MARLMVGASPLVRRVRIPGEVAAILLMSLGEEEASEVFKHLAPAAESSSSAMA